MKPLLLLLAVVVQAGPLSGACAAPLPDVPAVLGERYGQALQQVKIHWPGWRKALESEGVPADEVIAAVFPEVMRFSGLRNEVETFALKTLYVRKGSSYADFSVGAFQMKPSFVERLEEEVQAWQRSAPELFRKWARVMIAGNQGAAARRFRVERLSDPAWQLAYAGCFYDAADHRGLLRGVGFPDRVLVLASAYNAGFWLAPEEMNALAAIPRFGGRLSGSGLCSYRDITRWFVENDMPRICATQTAGR